MRNTKTIQAVEIDPPDFVLQHYKNFLNHYYSLFCDSIQTQRNKMMKTLKLMNLKNLVSKDKKIS